METDRQTLQPGLVRDYEPDKYSTYVRVGLGPDELFQFPIEPHCSSVLFSTYTYFLLIDHAWGMSVLSSSNSIVFLPS